MRCVKDVVSKAKEDGLKIMIGGEKIETIWHIPDRVLWLNKPPKWSKFSNTLRIT